MLTRAILAFDVDFFYMPISLVEENMEPAHARDAVNRNDFHFPATWLMPLKASVLCIETLVVGPASEHRL